MEIADPVRERIDNAVITHAPVSIQHILMRPPFFCLSSPSLGFDDQQEKNSNRVEVQATTCPLSVLSRVTYKSDPVSSLSHSSFFSLITFSLLPRRPVQEPNASERSTKAIVKSKTKTTSTTTSAHPSPHRVHETCRQELERHHARQSPWQASAWTPSLPAECRDRRGPDGRRPGRAVHC